MAEIVEVDGKKDSITVGEAVTWWTKNKNYVWAVVIAAVSLFGGNVDRVGSFLPDGLTKDKRVDDLVTKVDAIDARVAKLESAGNAGNIGGIAPAIREALREHTGNYRDN